MKRLALMFLLAIGVAAWAQEEASEPTEPAQIDPDDGEVTDEEFENLDLDDTDDLGEEAEDEFKASEDVLYQQSVPFPPDI